MKSESHLSLCPLLSNTSTCAGAWMHESVYTFTFCQTDPNSFLGWTDNSFMVHGGKKANQNSLQRQERTSTHYPHSRYVPTYVDILLSQKGLTKKLFTNHCKILIWILWLLEVVSGSRIDIETVSPQVASKSWGSESHRGQWEVGGKLSTAIFPSPVGSSGWANYRGSQDSAL